METDGTRDAAVNEYRRKLLEHRERSARVRSLRTGLNQVKTEFEKSEDDLKALQSVGQIIGEVLRQLDEDRLIVKASSGPRSELKYTRSYTHTEEEEHAYIYTYSTRRP